jgi:uncharacterized protein YggE
VRNWTSIGLTIALVASPALAQYGACPATGAPPTSGPPVLELSADATTKVTPDELVADLTVLGTAPTAVPAQHRVNTLMAEASKIISDEPAVKAVFRDYAVQYVDERPAHWVAQQTLELRGGDSEILLGIVGRLQALGLAIGTLDWEVSPGHAEKARRTAITAAIQNLRAEASDVATALRLAIDRYQLITLDGENRVFPLAGLRMNAAAAMASTITPPQTSKISPQKSAPTSSCALPLPTTKTILERSQLG